MPLSEGLPLVIICKFNIEATGKPLQETFKRFVSVRGSSLLKWTVPAFKLFNYILKLFGGRCVLVLVVVLIIPRIPEAVDDVLLYFVFKFFCS